MLRYMIATGAFSMNGKTLAYGYAGNGKGKNNPDAIKERGVGPLPPGNYTLTTVRDSQNTGPFSIVLEPDPANVMYGRGLFRIHGDSIAHPGEASDGCIILPRAIRDRIWHSGERQLVVV